MYESQDKCVRCGSLAEPYSTNFIKNYSLFYSALLDAKIFGGTLSSNKKPFSICLKGTLLLYLSPLTAGCTHGIPLLIIQPNLYVFIQGVVKIALPLIVHVDSP